MRRQSPTTSPAAVAASFLELAQRSGPASTPRSWPARDPGGRSRCPSRPRRTRTRSPARWRQVPRRSTARPGLRPRASSPRGRCAPTPTFRRRPGRRRCRHRPGRRRAGRRRTSTPAPGRTGRGRPRSAWARRGSAPPRGDQFGEPSGGRHLAAVAVAERDQDQGGAVAHVGPGAGHVEEEHPAVRARTGLGAAESIGPGRLGDRAEQHHLDRPLVAEVVATGPLGGIVGGVGLVDPEHLPDLATGEQLARVGDDGVPRVAGDHGRRGGRAGGRRGGVVAVVTGAAGHDDEEQRRRQRDDGRSVSWHPERAQHLVVGPFVQGAERPSRGPGGAPEVGAFPVLLQEPPSITQNPPRASTAC